MRHNNAQFRSGLDMTLQGFSESFKLVVFGRPRLTGMESRLVAHKRRSAS